MNYRQYMNVISYTYFELKQLLKLILLRSANVTCNLLKNFIYGADSKRKKNFKREEIFKPNFVRLNIYISVIFY